MFYAAATAKSLQSCPTLCDPVDGSPPGSPVPGILQARTLEWVAIGGFKSFITILGFPGGASGKEPAITDLGEKSKINNLTLHLRRRQCHPTPVLLPGKCHGWRRLVGSSPWGR